MVMRNGKKYRGVWYDLDIGYYTDWDNRYYIDDFFPISNFSIPHDEEKNYCVLYPEYPSRYSFSKGDLS